MPEQPLPPRPYIPRPRCARCGRAAAIIDEHLLLCGGCFLERTQLKFGEEREYQPRVAIIGR
jgi:ribosomal protein S14